MIITKIKEVVKKYKKKTYFDYSSHFKIQKKMSKKSRDLSKFIVNYWIRKENKEILTLNQLHQKEREQLARIQRRRRNDLKYWFELEIPEREVECRSKRIKRRPAYSIEPIAKRQKLNKSEQECVKGERKKGFFQSLLSCFGSF